MSRAINFALSGAELRERCAAADVRISVIEPLPGGGTRLVCSTVEGAEIMRRRHVKDMLEGSQKRGSMYVSSLQR